eukprot:m.725156 g.725156  ORF g.725156 m.725156 type:complete len:390 (-) comp23026_c1_seq1:488-1657(-)
MVTIHRRCGHNTASICIHLIKKNQRRNKTPHFIMTSHTKLSAAAVIERDSNGDILWSWIYPAVSAELRDVILPKTMLEDKEMDSPQQIFGRHKNTWFYIVSTPVSLVPDARVSDAVEALATVVISEDFNPEMYLKLAVVLTGKYVDGGSGPNVLNAFLSVYTSGKVDKFSVATHADVRKAYLRGSIKSVIKKFGIESILIYIAVLLKKRIIVSCPDVSELLATVRVLPQLVFKRLDWSILFPLVDPTDSEISAVVETKDYYIAGFTDSSVAIREDLYDLYVDVAGESITVASHAQNAFGLGKIHKDIAMYMTSAAEEDDTKDQDIVRELVERTDTLLEGLGKLAVPSDSDPEKQIVKIEAIRARKMAPSMHKFLYNLAVAENMTEESQA